MGPLFFLDECRKRRLIRVVFFCRQIIMVTVSPFVRWRESLQEHLTKFKHASAADLCRKSGTVRCDGRRSDLI